jgi:hypothetical protein
MTTLTDKFTAFEGQTASEHDETIATIGDINDVLALINTAIDTLNNNAATNTRYLLAAIASQDPCKDCTAPDISVPPVGTDPNPVSQDMCKRTQAFLHAMSEVYTVLDTMSAFGVPFTPSLIGTAISQVITALANGDTTPLPSFPESVQIVADGINYVASGFLVGDTLVGYFTPLLFDFRDAIFLTTTPSDAKAAYNGIIEGSSIPGYAIPIMEDAAYNALWSYYFDPSSDPNLTGYSGTACTVPSGACFTRDLIHTDSVPSGSTVELVVDDFGLFEGNVTTNSSSGPVTRTEPAFFAGNLLNWTIEVLIGHATVSYRAGDLSSSGMFSSTTNFGVDGTPHVLPASGSFYIAGDVGGRVRLCAP